MSNTAESTRKNPLQRVNWLFFSSANQKSLVYPMVVEPHTLDKPVGSFGWTAELRLQYRFRAKRVHFWKPNATLFISELKTDWIETVGDLKEIAELCQPAAALKYVLGESWDSRHVHFLITADKFEGDEDLEMSTIPESPLEKMNRRHDEVTKAANRPDPSTAARFEEYISLQDKSKTVIYDGSIVCDQEGRPQIITVAPPIQIFHPVFREFLDRNRDPKFEPDEQIIGRVIDLMPHFSQIFPRESDVLFQTRALLTDMLWGDMPRDMRGYWGSRDGLISKKNQNCRIPLIFVEYQASFGEGGCDPSLKAAYSVQNLLYKEKLGDLLTRSCCPSFILAGSSSLLSIYGVVQTDKFILQHLTDLHPVEATAFDDRVVYHLAKVFTSLSHARDTLDVYYQGILDSIAVPATPTAPADQPPRPRRCFFPHPTKFRERNSTEFTEFEYVDVPDESSVNVTFFAKIKSESSGRELVIKFVDRYGLEAHETLANEGMAPRLLYCGSLDGTNDDRDGGGEGRLECGLYIGPLRMVVMDRIEWEDTWPEDAREQVRKAIDLLHDEGFVFGDLRSPNVLFSKGKVFLIDFDWAGKVGEARYPSGLSTQAVWPAEASDLVRTLIKPEHDDFMLDRLFL